MWRNSQGGKGAPKFYKFWCNGQVLKEGSNSIALTGDLRDSMMDDNDSIVFTIPFPDTRTCVTCNFGVSHRINLKSKVSN